MLKTLQNKLKLIPAHIWILLIIVAVGIFLRTYRFHDWMEFRSDQARDASLVHNVLAENSGWPLLGPTVDGTGVGIEVENLFHLGPVYYWLQIISAKIFGDYPDKLAYPDLLFSVLSIPLFFFFLKRYFSKNLSLSLTGLYAVSFFAIYYSRFAWNQNTIPFFVLLLLLALDEIITHREKTSWIWIIVIGFGLGVGVQMHTIALLVFPVITFGVFIFTTKKNKQIWKKWVAVLFVFMLINSGQIISEIRTNFSNLKKVSSYFSFNHMKEKTNGLTKLIQNIDCHFEANAHILTSAGPDECSFYYIKALSQDGSKSFKKKLSTPIFQIIILGMLVFSIAGYGLWFNNLKKEKETKKRNFLRLTAIYSGLVFCVLTFLVKENINFRYFNGVFFVPFFFLGFFVNYLSRKFLRFCLAITIPMFLFAAIFNILSIEAAVKELSSKWKTGHNTDFLVQIEPLANYLIENTSTQKKIYLAGDFSIMHIYHPLEYFLSRENIKLIRLAKNGEKVSDIPLFYLSNKTPNALKYKKIGQIYVFEIKE